jgi:CubicO group peptidase (beta-lactamase class C family)
MRFPSLLVMVAAIGVAAPRAQPQGARPAPATIAAAVDSLAARVVAAGLTPAFGVAIVMDGETVFTRAYGLIDVDHRVPANDGTLWYLASTSKSYTGFGVSQLAQQGVLDFEDPIATLLPKARWYPGVDPHRLTLANFLSHTHHLDDGAIVMSAAFTGEIPEAQWPALLGFSKPTGSTDLVYSNLGYNVAAMVIDAKRPEGWRRYLDSAVYAPAGMTETYTHLSGLDRRRIAMPHLFHSDGSFTTATFYKTDATMNSAGGHVATLHDLARWITVQMDSGVIDGKRVFPAAAVALSHRMIAPQTRESAKHFAYFDRAGWGAGWDLGSYEGEPMVSRFGSYSSLRSHISMLPRRRIGVVAMANGQPGFTATDLIAAFAYDLEAGKPNARAVAEQRFQDLIAQLSQGERRLAASDSVRAARQHPMDRPLSDFVGSYHSDGFGTIRFALRGDTLYYDWGAVYGPAEVFDAAKRQMRVEISSSGTVVSFLFGGRGPATAIQVMGETFTRRP